MAALADPLPGHYVTSGDGVGGRIKVRPEDFLVEEIPLYEPAGEGEHLYLGVEKTRVSHGELISCLARYFGVRESAVGFAGMKDKQGITRQTISVHLLQDPPEVQPSHARIQVLWAERHRNKLRRGHLAGNRFSIKIRDIDATKAPRVLRLLRHLEQVGVPAYFGSQRFGYRRNNHLLGMALLRGAWQAALDELLGAGGSAYPDYQRERRELYGAGRYDEAARLWTTADRAELAAINALRRGRSPQDTCLGIHPIPRSFWMSAVQSAIFNRVLDERIAAGSLDRLVEGDLAWKHDNGAVFPVGRAEVDDPGMHERLGRIEVSPSGPLWGPAMPHPGAAVEAVERRALEAMGIDVASFLESPWAPTGGRRHLRAPLRHPEVDAGVDEHGHYVRLAFDLSPGVYATVVLREIMKGGEREGGGGEGEGIHHRGAETHRDLTEEGMD